MLAGADRYLLGRWERAALLHPQMLLCCSHDCQGKASWLQVQRLSQSSESGSSAVAAAVAVAVVAVVVAAAAAVAVVDFVVVAFA